MVTISKNYLQVKENSYLYFWIVYMETKKGPAMQWIYLVPKRACSYSPSISFPHHTGSVRGEEAQNKVGRHLGSIFRMRRGLPKECLEKVVGEEDT